MQEVTLQLGDLACPSCAQTISKILKRQKGVGDATVAFTSSRVKVSFDPEVITLEQIEQAIEKTGYKVKARL
ncbi:MAG TPA: heavy-metal-associated domain-containing protein [Firmicutes bacterium]|jgi:copper chaperone CopZ|nr:heavy-metal-associated domain-containing protein [Bacillota bacterium]